MQNIILRGFGFNQKIITRGYGGIFHWIKKLLSNAFVKIKYRKYYIFPAEPQKGYVQPTDGKIN